MVKSFKKFLKSKEETVDNPYAIGMAAAMKAKDDQPPLKKSTIAKAHHIADKIKKEYIGGMPSYSGPGVDSFKPMVSLKKSD